MKSIDPWADDEQVVAEHHPNANTYTAERVLVGNCPECGRVCVVFNDRETWPVVACPCGWRADTLSLDNRHRIEGVEVRL